MGSLADDLFFGLLGFIVKGVDNLFTLNNGIRVSAARNHFEGYSRESIIIISSILIIIIGFTYYILAEATKKRKANSGTEKNEQQSSRKRPNLEKAHSGCAASKGFKKQCNAIPDKKSRA